MHSFTLSLTSAIGGAVVVSVKVLPLYPREKNPVPTVQETGWAPGPVYTSAENLAPQGFDPRTVQDVARRYTD
jgi:hypothetical protein